MREPSVSWRLRDDPVPVQLKPYKVVKEQNWDLAMCSRAAACRFRCRYSLLPLSLPLSSLSLLAATVPTATITAPALALAITAATLPASPPPIAAATLPSPPRSRRRYRCHRCRHYSRLVAIAAVALSSPWPLHPSKVHTRTSDDQRRKDAGRESERDSGSIRRHDDYSRHRRHVDEKNRNYLMSSRAGRESRDYRHSDDTEKHKNKNKEREPDKDYDGDISTPRLKESEKGDVPSSSSRQDKQLHEKINSETLNSTTNNVEATGDVNSAKVAAMKAAEFVNRNLVGVWRGRILVYWPKEKAPLG
ncbi:hypothetical protein MUK42_33523 [Musa troglodytarum]|uniref:Uncharacterized protein n=1 Tax=Musa troglodytarum TaxID=320322 RepID=A0A9E7HFG3_9LILI|nr:hypothetical protein MUK42_33523 [Musa troglodytarum]